MSTALRTPSAQHVRPQMPEPVPSAKPVARPSRRKLLRSGLFGMSLAVCSRAVQHPSPQVPCLCGVDQLRQLVTKVLFVGFAGLAGSQTASADQGTQSSQQNEGQKQAPSLNDLQKHQV